MGNERHEILKDLLSGIAGNDPQLVMQLKDSLNEGRHRRALRKNGEQPISGRPDGNEVTYQAKYRSLIEQIPAVIFTGSFKDGLDDFYVSPHIEALLGYAQSEWLDNPVLWYERLHPDDKQRWQRDLSETLGCKRNLKSNYRFVAKDGRVVWIHVAAHLVNDAYGNPLFIHGIGFDISEVHEARRTSADAERRFRTIFNAASDIISNITPDALIATLSPAFEVITGFKCEEWIGKPFFPLIHPEDLFKIKALLREFRDGSCRQATFELRLKTVAGSYKYVESVARPIFDKNELTGVFSISRDITSRKSIEEDRVKLHMNLEQQVRERTKELSLYKDLFDSSSDAMLTLDLSGEITGWNKTANKFFDISSVKHRNISCFLPELSSLELKDRLEKGEVRTTKSTVKVGGAARNLSVSVSPILGEVGMEAISVIATDITEQVEAERRFRLAIEAAPNAMIMVDAHGTIKLVNRLAEELFGYSRDEILGQSVELLVPAKYRHQHTHLRENYLKDPVTREMGKGRELFGICKNGKEVPVEIGLNPIATPEGMFVLSSIIDIGQRKAAENEIRAKNEELERTNDEMEQFIYTVSHDLKSPIVTMTSFLGFLKEDLREGRAEDIAESMEHIERATKRMQELINDLLELSRVGRWEIHPDDVDINEVLQGILESLQNRISGKHIKVAVPRPLPVIRGDRKRLRQVFENLLTNAIKYGCTLNQPRISISWYRNKDEFVFEVEDNGPGIAQVYHEKIFKLFQRLDQSEEGTGVGLAIVAKIMELHNGRVWVESEVGKGAKFCIAIPQPKELL